MIFRLFSRVLVVATLVAVLVGGTILLARTRPAPKAAPEEVAARNPMTDDYGPAPAFAVSGLSSADLKGKAVVLSFFASWCAPCRLEHPVLMGISKQATVWGVDTMDHPEDLKVFLRGEGNPFAKIGHDDSGEAGAAWGVTGIPATFVVAPNGHIVYRHLGPINEAEARLEILPLLAYLKAKP